MVEEIEEYILHTQNLDCVALLDGSTLFVFKSDETTNPAGLNVSLAFYINSCYNFGRIYTW